MLKLYLGRAGSGKTSAILRELGKLAAEKKGGHVLIVPEQYSHDCERALAAQGDDVCLYCEVLSFTRLAARVFAETGGLARPTLDAGGRTLAMSLAYMSVSSALKVYDVGGRRPDFVKSLLAAYDELRSARAGTDKLLEASEKASGSLAGKLSDLALLFERFEAVKEQSGADDRDVLERLADQIGESSVGEKGGVWIDGFTDFTHQELRVIDELLRRGADVTVCLGVDDLASQELPFRLPAKTGRKLLAMAKSRGVERKTVFFEKRNDRDPALSYLERALLDYSAPPYEGTGDALRVYAAGSLSEECAVAAARALELVRAGARYRDIAVVSPAFAQYAPLLEGMFAKYGVPVTSTEKSDILDKPAMAMLTGALEIIAGGWDYQSVFKYLKTGLTGLSSDEADLLENYVLKWNLRGESAWRRPWEQAPGGYADGMTDEDRQTLERLNEAREAVAGPVLKLAEALEARDSALEKTRAVYTFLEDTGLYAKLEAKAAELKARGRTDLAQEYRQLWQTQVRALTQFAAILGETAIETEEFIRLLKLVLAQYKVGVIPSSVDSVRAGDMTRLRARGVKHLIVLGAVDGALPVSAASGGVFSDDERESLRELGIDTLDDREDSLARELSGVYMSLTVPTGSLTFTYPDARRRSYIVSRVEKLFSLQERIPGAEIWSAAPEPCFELAASGDRTARHYFEHQPAWADRLKAVERAAQMRRGSLTDLTARRLYGKNLRLSASQIDRFYSCRYAYFLQYGLKARPRQEAALDAPESGTFVHFVLERVARAVGALEGGFRSPEVTEAFIRAEVEKAVAAYAETRLGGLENKSGRFRYLFARLTETAAQVALNMREELADSDFTPLDFELRFAEDAQLPPVRTEDGDAVIGTVDRVDGWEHDGKLYLRVVDYKTGKKKLELSDILYGVGLQMFIYLFALEREGSARYQGKPIVPAGVLYSPARDAVVTNATDLPDGELQAKREELLRFSGLVLADSDVLRAMERGGPKRIPVRISSKTGELVGALAGAEELGKLGKTVDRLVRDMAREVRQGSITADPYLRNAAETACRFCKFYDACRFSDGDAGESWRRIYKLKDADFWALLDKREAEAGDQNTDTERGDG